MTAKIDKNELVIRIPITEGTVSKSGKSLTVATTSGIVPAGVEYQGKPLKVGVNAFIPR